jgi:hypothetical protein
MEQAKFQIGYNVPECPRSSMDRVTDFESGGCEFDPRRGRQNFLCFLAQPLLDNWVIIL